MVVGGIRTGDVSGERGGEFYEGKVCEVDEEAEEASDEHVQDKARGGDSGSHCHRFAREDDHGSDEEEREASGVLHQPPGVSGDEGQCRLDGDRVESDKPRGQDTRDEAVRGEVELRHGPEHKTAHDSEA